GVFQHVSGDAGVQCPPEVPRAGEGGDDEHPRGEALGGDGLRHVEPAHLGHLDVGQQNVGSMLTHRLQRLLPVGGRRHHFDVFFEIEEGGEGREHHRLVLGQDDPDHGVPTGRLTRSRVPGGPLRSTRPPAAITLSRIPRRPEPSGSLAPTPSSATSRTTSPGEPSRVMTQCDAWAWRTTFVTASRKARARTVSTEGARSWRHSPRTSTATPSASRASRPLASSSSRSTCCHPATVSRNDARVWRAVSSIAAASRFTRSGSESARRCTSWLRMDTAVNAWPARAWRARAIRPRSVTVARYWMRAFSARRRSASLERDTSSWTERPTSHTRIRAGPKASSR